MKFHRCVDCLVMSPVTTTAYTLIGTKFRWRVSRRTDADGTIIVDWRCPECWRKYKEALGEPMGTAATASSAGRERKSS